MTLTYRQHTEAEIRQLRGSSAWLRFKLTDFLGVASLTLLFYAGGGWFVGKGVAHLLSRAFSAPSMPTVLPPLLCSVGATWAVVSIVRGERARSVARQRSEESTAASLRGGRVELVECDVTEAAELEEYEDEGPGFFLQVAPDVLLFLQGQHLMVDDFPACKLSLARDSHSRFILDLQHSGQRVEPKRRIHTKKFGGVEWLQGGMFIRGTVDGLPSDVEALPEQRDVLGEAF